MKMELKLYEMRMAGREETLISLIKKKLSAGKDIERIADEVEETVEKIQPIVDILTEHPEYDVDEVYHSIKGYV